MAADDRVPFSAALAQLAVLSDQIARWTAAGSPVAQKGLPIMAVDPLTAALNLVTAGIQAATVFHQGASVEQQQQLVQIHLDNMALMKRLVDYVIDHALPAQPKKEKS